MNLRFYEPNTQNSLRIIWRKLSHLTYITKRSNHRPGYIDYSYMVIQYRRQPRITFVSSIHFSQAASVLSPSAYRERIERIRQHVAYRRCSAQYTYLVLFNFRKMGISFCSLFDLRILCMGIPIPKYVSQKVNKKRYPFCEN